MNHPARVPVEELSREALTAIALNEFPAAGLPELVWSDGPNGVRDAQGSTAFPSQLALAATFDPSLAHRYGRAVARECLAAGRNAFLGPGLDIARVPWAGRLSETLGEDPALVGALGVEIVRGVQGAGVLAVPKHFIANNFESLRTGRGSFVNRTDAVDVRVGPGVLRDVYAEPFRRALLDGGAGAVLTSYNRINGAYASQSPEVFGILRDEWGWDGLVVPDFIFAVRDDEAALNAGLDVPALGGPAGRSLDLINRLPHATLARIAAHVTSGITRAGVTDAPAPALPLDDADSQDLAQEILERGAVLLKNNGALPLPASTSRVVVIGADAPTHLLVTGGSAGVAITPSRISPLASALAATTGFDISAVEGGCEDVPGETAEIHTAVVFTDQVSGARTAYDYATFEVFGAPEGIGPDWSATATATYVPEVSGAHRLSVTFGGEATLIVNGVRIASGAREAARMIEGPEYPLHATVQLEAGARVDVTLEYETGPAITVPGLITPGFRLGVTAYAAKIDAAAAEAAAADVAIVLAGRVSGEAMDIESIALPGDQDALISAVAAANPNTIVVTLGAGPISMPWLDAVASVIHAWTPGERFGPGIARLLTGAVEPTGRLPLTFPVDDATTPVSDPSRYPGEDGVVHYTEGSEVGYRWYLANDRPTLFPFGFGLGYASLGFALREIAADDTGLSLYVDVANPGDREGAAVVQVYVSAPGEGAPGLKGFAPVRVPAGGQGHARIEIPTRAFAAYNAAAGVYRVEGGDYAVSVGTSSAHVFASALVALEPRTFAPDFRN